MNHPAPTTTQLTRLSYSAVPMSHGMQTAFRADATPQGIHLLVPFVEGTAEFIVPTADAARLLAQLQAALGSDS